MQSLQNDAQHEPQRSFGSFVVSREKGNSYRTAGIFGWDNLEKSRRMQAGHQVTRTMQDVNLRVFCSVFGRHACRYNRQSTAVPDIALFQLKTNTNSS
jgi:hypothetical protein